MSINKTYAVFGLGRYGKAVAEELVKNGAEVLGVDVDQDIVDNAVETIPVCKCADITETSLDKGTQRKTTENELPSLTQCTA